MADNSRSRDILPENVRNRHQEDEQETEIRFRYYVRLFQSSEVRRRGERRLSWRSADYIDALQYVCIVTVTSYLYFSDIKIHFALREPHSKLFRATDANKLLVVTYAWDGNALPGLSDNLIN